jgi:tyrosyl-DNA phosphodiesterase 2
MTPIGNSSNHSDKKTVKIMTYNVWFREELELIRRMNAIGDLIQHHSPDLICFQVLYSNYALLIFLFYLAFGYSFVELQEVTPNIYLLFEKSDWWQAYKCSLPHEVAMQRPYYSMQVNISQTEMVMEIP